jgi:hypothetical protein
MTSPITCIQIADVEIDLSNVEYQVSVQHGRNDVLSQPEASSAQIVIRGSEGVAVKMADSLKIGAYGGFCRFTGEVSDIQIVHLSSDPPEAITTIIAMGNLAKLGLALTGTDGFDHETVRERAEVILTDGGLNYLNGGSDSLEMHQTDPNIVPVLQALQELAEGSGATFFDTPEGLIAFESYGDRGLTHYANTWNALQEPWTFYEQSWDSFPTSFASYTFPESGVVFSPTWTQNLTSLVNDVTVSYGNPDNLSYEQSEDSASIALYGRRSYSLTSGLRKEADATARAGSILTAQANPLWQMGQISVLVHELDTQDRDIVLALVNGATVTVPGLPSPAPYTSFTGIVEGWAETYTPGQHIITFSISDPRYSYQTVTWADVDPALEWGNVNPGVAWYNVVKADDLIAA